MERHRKTTTLRLTEQDIQAILKIRQAYGIASDNQAIIFALRFTARHIEKEGPPDGGAAIHSHA
ncbi:MAG TPA: hypothetical protein VFN02_08770 [Ktedonobacteraceae bacterium]|nr:hypothetical protein [Ktedonobacteraceae bacterium]